MDFLRKVIAGYLSKEKIPSFQIIQERSCLDATFFEKTIFSKDLKKISYFLVFFLKKIIFYFPPRIKIIFSRKRNIIFPNNTRKIIFQRDFFGKTIFSGRLEKENMVFRAVLLIVLADHLLKTKKEFRNFKKQKIKTIFTKINMVKHVVTIAWLIKILKT